MSSTPIIQAQNISKTYTGKETGKELTVLSDLSIQLNSGSVTSVVGPSGSGKSTLLHILGGLDTADQGHVFWNGKNITEYSNDALSAERNKFLGFVFQFHHLLPEFSALENVAMPALIQGKEIDEARDRAMELLSHFGVADRSGHRPTQLSGGEQQRVSMARALMNKPQVILADEPTGNLDDSNTKIILDLLFDLKEQEDVAILIITHELDIAKRSDAVYELRGGSLHQFNK